MVKIKKKLTKIQKQARKDAKAERQKNMNGFS